MKLEINDDAEKKVMNFFAGMADKTRLRILLSLTDGPKSVGDIYEYVGKSKMTLSAISHQLKQLNDTGIVKSERDGQEKKYQLSNDFCWCIIRDAFKHFNGDIGIKGCTKCNKLKEKKND